MLVKLGSYGNYASDNYSGHCIRLQMGSLTLYFSYKTVVAFCDGNSEMQICENVWGPTTGKHLNWLDAGNKKERIEQSEFKDKLQVVLDKHGLVL